MRDEVAHVGHIRWNVIPAKGVKELGADSKHNYSLCPCVKIERVRTRHSRGDSLELLPQLPPTGCVGGRRHTAIEDAPPESERGMRYI
jgi:hypothetical protein